MYYLLDCTHNFCDTHLNCCSSCGAKSHSICIDKCSDCASSYHFFHSCPKLLRWLHEHGTSYHTIYFGKILIETGLSHAHHHIPKQKVNCYQEGGVIISCFILICYSIFFPVFLLDHGFSINQNLLYQ